MYSLQPGSSAATMDSFVALVPVNRLDRAKGRLADVLSVDERAELARCTLTTVLAAIRDAGGHSIVLSPEESIAGLLGSRVELLLEDPDRNGLNAQLEYALESIGASEVLILHADLPLATGSALRDFLARAVAPAPSITVVRSPDGGTNAMLLRPPGSIPLRYGRDSARLHRQAALAAGVTFSMCSAPALMLDLDTPEDLARLLVSDEGRRSRAGALLTQWRVLERPGVREA
jgi:2-phospho-L-lactate/phosphoenolpyruvate guanylyltransferase